MSIHINVAPGLPRNEVIRFNQPDDASWNKRISLLIEAASMTASEWRARQINGEDAQRGLKFTLANLNNAFDSLCSSGQMGRNANAIPQLEPNRFERKVYVGQQNPAVTPPTGGSKIVHRKTWTNQEIRNLSADQYQQLLSDPDFVAAVNSSDLGR